MVRGVGGSLDLLEHPLWEGSWQALGLVENGLQRQGEGWMERAGGCRAYFRVEPIGSRKDVVGEELKET